MSTTIDTGRQIVRNLGFLPPVGSGELSSREVAMFDATGTLTSSAAATPVVLLPASMVPAGFRVVPIAVFMRVDGGTAWATTANVKVQDTNDTPVDFVTVQVSALGANARVNIASANVTIEDAVLLGTGGTPGRGVQVRGNANGTGSDLRVRVVGYIVKDNAD